MSLETWKEEFYLDTAQNVAGRNDTIECIEHSLTKWKGALDSNAERHGLSYVSYSLGTSDDAMDFDSSTCSLCEKFFDYESTINSCSECPLVIAGFKSCGDNLDDPYSESRYDPSPMVRALEHTLNFYKNGEYKKVK